MNHCYRLVLSADGLRYVPVPETSRSRGKSSGSKALCSASVLLGALVAGNGYAEPITPNTLPTGHQVITGSAEVISDAINPNKLNIQQSTDKAIINWQSFNIGSQAHVDFQQLSSSSVTLNRVVAGNASKIHGKLTANGNVWVVNPNGVVFGSGSQINVGGLVASTMDMSNQDFMDGKTKLEDLHKASGHIINEGEIEVSDGGSIALIGTSQVINNGLITAPLGSVVLAAGEAATLTLPVGANGYLQVAVDPTTAATLVQNNHMIVADGGYVLMSSSTASDIAASVVNNSGTIQAQTMAEAEGRIVLQAASTGNNSNVFVSGSLDTSAPTVGDGGSIELAASQIQITDEAQITASSTTGTAGQLSLQAGDISVGSAETDSISAEKLGNVLNAAHVTLQAQAAKGGDGSVKIADAVSWDSTSNLALNASSNVEIQGRISAEEGQLTLNAGNKITATADVNIQRYTQESGDWEQKTSTLPEFIAQDFRINGGKFLRVAGGSGTSNSPYVITDVYGLQGMAGYLNDHFRLGQNIDANITKTWNCNAGTCNGFVPIGDNRDGTVNTQFGGEFNGNGYSIDNLFVNITTPQNKVSANNKISYAGLFGFVRSTAVLSKVSLNNADISATGGNKNYAGAMAGHLDLYTSGHSALASHVQAFGSGENYAGVLVGASAQNRYIQSSHTSGSATAFGGSKNYAGGIIGYSLGGVYSSYSTADVTAYGDSDSENYAGGITGYNTANMGNDYATGTVLAYGGKKNYAGGLIGHHNGANLYASYATGDVTAHSDNNSSSENYAGGIIGWQHANTQTSYATGTVSAFGGLNNYAGGLVGRSTGNLRASYATGDVSAADGSESNYAGGLAGEATSNTYENYATGTATASGGKRTYAGGLMGKASTRVQASYALGAATAQDGSVSNYAGGLVGESSGGTHYNYAIGKATATSETNAATNNAGAVVGRMGGGSANNNYWDPDASGMTQGVGYKGSLTFTDIQLNNTNRYLAQTYANLGTLTEVSPGVFTITGASINSSFSNTNKVLWVIFDGNARPFLETEYSTNVGNTHQLQLMAYKPNASYTLIRDIDAEETKDGISGMWSEQGFVPIGSSSANAFEGTLTGANKVISNLYINRTKAQDVPNNAAYAGLFGYLGAAGNITNVYLKDADITASDSTGAKNYAGALAAYYMGTALSNNHITGDSQVTASGVGENYAALLVGLTGDNTVMGSVSAAGSAQAINGTKNYAGAVAAYAKGRITSATATGNALAQGTSTSSNYAGGIVGYAEKLFSSGTASGNVTASGGTNNFAGGVAGRAIAEVSRGSASGTVLASGGQNNYAGGLVGEGTTTISNGVASGQVTASDGSILNYAGGLAGKTGGNTTSSHASGNAIASGAGAENTAGGLVAYQGGNIQTGSYATGNATASGGSNNYAGGLVGQHRGANTKNSYATGNAYAAGGTNNYAGGLTGVQATGNIDESYATGNATATSGTGNHFAGGLVGSQTSGNSSSNYASGDALASGGTNTYAGGLVGKSTTSIRTSYATGNATAQEGIQANYAGGLGGRIYGGVHKNYSMGSATATGTGSNYVGGLFGYVEHVTPNSGVTGNYWNLEDSGLTQADGQNKLTTASAVGLTNEQMKHASSFAAWGMDINDLGGASSNSIWRIYEGYSTPLLRKLLTQTNVTLIGDLDKTYDATIGSSIGSDGYVIANNVTLGGAGNDLNLTTNSANVGNYKVSDGTLKIDGLYSSHLGYDINYVTQSKAAALNITPKAITVTANDATKTYGQSDGVFTYAADGLIGNDTLSGNLTRVAGENVGSYDIQLGDLANGNYDISFVGNVLTITPKAITVTANNASKREGQQLVFTGREFTTSGLVGNEVIDHVDLSTEGAVITAKLDSYSIQAGNAQGSAGFDSRNYDITYVNGRLSVQLIPAIANGAEFARTPSIQQDSASPSASIANTVVAGANIPVTAGGDTVQINGVTVLSSDSSTFAASDAGASTGSNTEITSPNTGSNDSGGSSSVESNTEVEGSSNNDGNSTSGDAEIGESATRTVTPA